MIAPHARERQPIRIRANGLERDLETLARRIEQHAVEVEYGE